MRAKLHPLGTSARASLPVQPHTVPATISWGACRCTVSIQLLSHLPTAAPHGQRDTRGPSNRVVGAHDDLVQARPARRDGQPCLLLAMPLQCVALPLRLHALTACRLSSTSLLAAFLPVCSSNMNSDLVKAYNIVLKVRRGAPLPGVMPEQSMGVVAAATNGRRQCDIQLMGAPPTLTLSFLELTPNLTPTPLRSFWDASHSS